MEDTYKKYHFSAISIKRKTADRFRAFSRLVSDSHTRTLETIMDFFERNDLSPNDDLGIHNNRTNKRINALIAILKNIEKQQTLPTKMMLDTLFQEMTEMEMSEEASFDFGPAKLLDNNDEIEFYKNGYENAHGQLSIVLEKLDFLLERVQYVKSTFGSDYLKIDMDKETFDTLKRELQNVHHDYGTEN